MQQKKTVKSYPTILQQTRNDNTSQESRRRLWPGPRQGQHDRTSAASHCIPPLPWLFGVHHDAVWVRPTYFRFRYLKYPLITVSRYPIRNPGILSSFGSRYPTCPGVRGYRTYPEKNHRTLDKGLHFRQLYCVQYGIQLSAALDDRRNSRCSKKKMF